MVSSYVRIGDWQNRRQLLEMDGKIALEIALQHHCPTCDERIRFVSRKLAERGIVPRWIRPNQDSSFIELDVPADQPAKQFLTELFGLSVS